MLNMVIVRGDTIMSYCSNLLTKKFVDGNVGPNDVMDCREIYTRSQEGCKILGELAKSSTEADIKDRFTLIRETLCWDVRPSIVRSSVVVNIEQKDGGVRNLYPVKLSVTYKGNPLTAKRVTFLNPGFGNDSRAFQKSIEEYKPAKDEALVVISVIGRDVSIPKELRLTPKILVDALVKATRKIAPNAKDIVIGGNSLGAMLSLGMVLKMYREDGMEAHYIADDPMTWNVLDDIQPVSVQLLGVAHRLSSLFGSRVMMDVSFTTLKTNLMLGFLVSGFYSKTDLIDGTEIEPTDTDTLYFQNNFHHFQGTRKISSPLYEAANMMYYGARGWGEYLTTEFPEYVKTDESDSSQIKSIKLPPQSIAVLSRALGSVLFSDESVELLRNTLSGHKVIGPVKSFGSHVEGTDDGRMADMVHLTRRVQP